MHTVGPKTRAWLHGTLPSSSFCSARCKLLSAPRTKTAKLIGFGKHGELLNYKCSLLLSFWTMHSSCTQEETKIYYLHCLLSIFSPRSTIVVPITLLLLTTYLVFVLIYSSRRQNCEQTEECRDLVPVHTLELRFIPVFRLSRFFLTFFHTENHTM